MSDRRALMGAALGSVEGLDWADVTEITIGANSITNTTGVKAYFSNYTYNYIILTSAPTAENQIVACAGLTKSDGMNVVFRYRGGSLTYAGISSNHDGVLVEGTKYCLLSWRDLT